MWRQDGGLKFTLFQVLISWLTLPVRQWNVPNRKNGNFPAELTRYYSGSIKMRLVSSILIFSVWRHAKLYLLVVDILIQHQPHITALVWGGIRSLLSVCFTLCIHGKVMASLTWFVQALQVAIREIEIADKIGSSLLDLLKHIGRWETYLQLWPASPRLSTALVELLAQIINFLVRASIYHQIPPHSELWPFLPSAPASIIRHN